MTGTPASIQRQHVATDRAFAGLEDSRQVGGGSRPAALQFKQQREQTISAIHFENTSVNDVQGQRKGRAFGTARLLGLEQFAC
jgi:hypothetical protein